MFGSGYRKVGLKGQGQIFYCIAGSFITLSEKAKVKKKKIYAVGKNAIFPTIPS